MFPALSGSISRRSRTALAATALASAVQLQTPQLFLAVLLASAVSLVLFTAVVLAERQLLRRWHESALPADE